MIRPAIALFVTLAALAPPPEAVASGGDPLQKPAPQAAPLDDADALPAPPGSAADVALWRSGQATTETMWAERNRASLIQSRLRSNQVLERLEATAARAEPKEQAALLALRARLLEAWEADYRQLTRQWPVDPTRGCGYTILAFDSALRASAAADRGELAQARGELKECIARTEGVVRPLVEATRALEAVGAEANRALRPRAGEPAEKAGKKEAKEEEHEHGEHGKGKE